MDPKSSRIPINPHHGPRIIGVPCLVMGSAVRQTDIIFALHDYNPLDSAFIESQSVATTGRSASFVCGVEEETKLMKCTSYCDQSDDESGGATSPLAATARAVKLARFRGAPPSSSRLTAGAGGGVGGGTFTSSMPISCPDSPTLDAALGQYGEVLLSDYPSDISFRTFEGITILICCDPPPNTTVAAFVEEQQMLLQVVIGGPSRVVEKVSCSVASGADSARGSYAGSPTGESVVAAGSGSFLQPPPPPCRRLRHRCQCLLPAIELHPPAAASDPRFDGPGSALTTLSKPK